MARLSVLPPRLSTGSSRERRGRISASSWVVGHYLDVGADAAEQAQQGQPVQGSYGVVRDYHDPAAGGDVLELGLAHPVVKIEGA